ncbi:MAG: glycosyltransferase [Myxococcota bacterium]
MKVIVIGKYHSEGFASLISDELEQLGHVAVRFDPGPTRRTGSKWVMYANRAIEVGNEAIRSIRRSLGLAGIGSRVAEVIADVGPVDLILSIHDYLTHFDVSRIRRVTSAPLALWFPDPIWSFGRHMFLNAEYDFLFFKDPYVVDVLRRKLGARVYYLPEAFSPSALDVERINRVERKWECDITVAGNMYSYRVAMLQNLPAHYTLKVWGPPPPRWLDLGSLQPSIQGQYVAAEDKVRAFRSAKIVLNTHNPAEIAGTNVRTFEAAGVGAFQLADFKVGIGDLFVPGREIVMFDRAEELHELLEHYINDEHARKTISRAAMSRARRDHTYAKRLALLLDTVGGTASGFPEPKPVWRCLFGRAG